MQKIMFNDLYGLTKAVIDGHKNMTRRIVPDRMGKLLDVNSKGWLIIPRSNIPDCMTPEQFAEEFAKHHGVITFEKNDVKEVKPEIDIREECIKLAPYKVGEVVSVAQSYKDLGYTKEWVEQHISPNPNANKNDPFEKKYPGWSNKMFVPAELNKAHQIQITDIKVDRLQAISEEDCLKEGVWIDSHREVLDDNIYTVDVFLKHYCQWHFPSAREAFSFLIDKVSGKGTWESNPFVFAYTFKLVK